MNFSDALVKIKTGERLRRAGWNGKGQFVYLAVGVAHFGEQFQPFLILHNAQGQRQPGWLPSMGDLLAEDWEIAQ